MGKKHFQVRYILSLCLLVIIFLSVLAVVGNIEIKCCKNETIKLCHEDVEISAIGTKNVTTDWNYIGNCYYNLKCYNQSIEYYDKAINAYKEATWTDPNYAEAWNNKGDALYYKKSYGEAEEAYNNSINLNKSLNKSWYGKGKSLVRQNKIDDV